MTWDCGKGVWEWQEGRTTSPLSFLFAGVQARLPPRGQGKVVAPGRWHVLRPRYLQIHDSLSSSGETLSSLVGPTPVLHLHPLADYWGSPSPTPPKGWFPFPPQGSCLCFHFASHSPCPAVWRCAQVSATFTILTRESGYF